MKRFIKILGVAALSAVILSSCAKQVDEDFDEVRDNAFDQWMAIYHPDVELKDYGVYVEEIVKTDGDGVSPEDYDWVKINYTGYLIDGSVFATRYQDIAENIGTFEYTTYFTPQLTYLNEYVMPVGMIEALKTMKPGDRSMLYIPSSLAYVDCTASFVTGYVGTSYVYSDAPIIIDLELVEVMDDIVQYEVDLVEDYALENFKQVASDTISESMYMIFTDSIVGSQTVTYDSVVYLNYKGTFLDGFVFDTNIEDVAVANDIYSEDKTYSALKYDVAGEEDVYSDGDYIYAFYKAFINDVHTVKYNDSFTIVFPSTYAYTYLGSTSGSTEIQPYTPLIFEIQVLPYMGHSGKSYSPYYLINDLDDSDADPKEDVYMFGYVVGCVNGSTIDSNTVQMEEDTFTSTTNLLIASLPTETDMNNCVVVDISSNQEMQEDYNLVDNPNVLGWGITFNGDISLVKGRVGLTNLVYERN